MLYISICVKITQYLIHDLGRYWIYNMIDERVNIRTCNEGEHQGMIVSFYFLFYII